MKIAKTKSNLVNVTIEKKTLDKLENLFVKEEKKKPIKTRQGILKAMNIKMRECLITEDKKRRERNYSEALINDNYFFALFFLREDILGKDLNVHKERKRLLRGKDKK